MIEIIAHDLTATINIAKLLAKKITFPFNLCLDGDLGAGKTTFARAFLETLGVAPETISSPTFTIVNEYSTATAVINHIDLYRINNYQELDALGYLELLNYAQVNLIEWSLLFPNYKPSETIELAIKLVSSTERVLIFSATNQKLATLLQELKNDYFVN